MAESAIRIEGIDEATRQNVRIHLRVLTSEEATPAITRFAAPSGFLSDALGREVQGRRAADISSCKAQVFGSPPGLESVATPGVFAAPRGFLPKS